MNDRVSKWGNSLGVRVPKSIAARVGLREGARVDIEAKGQTGDIVWTDFDPRLGRERGGQRPALVLSPAAFFKASRFAIVCPITSRVRGFKTSVVLPEDLAIRGEVLTSHVRSIDTQARPVAFSGTRVSVATLAEARAKVAALIGL